MAGVPAVGMAGAATPEGIMEVVAAAWGRVAAMAEVLAANQAVVPAALVSPLFF